MKKPIMAASMRSRNRSGGSLRSMRRISVMLPRCPRAVAERCSPRGGSPGGCSYAVGRPGRAGSLSSHTESEGGGRAARRPHVRRALRAGVRASCGGRWGPAFEPVCGCSCPTRRSTSTCRPRCRPERCCARSRSVRAARVTDATEA
jgi:hypothetical protein